MSTKFNIRIEHGVLTFRNFAGVRKQFNDEGKRNFCVYLDGYDRKGRTFENQDYIPVYKYGPDFLNPNELIDALTRDGWNIKWTKPSEDGEYPSRPYLKVNVKYNPDWPQFNPDIFLVRTDGGTTSMDKDSIHQLDTTWIGNADMIIKPNNYEERQGVENGKVSADLKTLYVTPVEDESEDDFDGKYNNSRSGYDDSVPFN